MAHPISYSTSIISRHIFQVTWFIRALVDACMCAPKKDLFDRLITFFTFTAIKNSFFSFKQSFVFFFAFVSSYWHCSKEICSNIYLSLFFILHTELSTIAVLLLFFEWFLFFFAVKICVNFTITELEGSVQIFSTINLHFIKFYSYDVAYLIPNWMKFFQEFFILNYKGQHVLTFTLLKYPLICGVVISNGSTFYLSFITFFCNFYFWEYHCGNTVW